MTIDFERGAALVVGGSVGMGRGIVQALAEANARIMIADVDEQGGAETVELARAAGAEAAFVRCDVADADDLRGAVAATQRAFGGLRHAVNNAGVEAARINAADIEEREWERSIGVNLTGVWRCMKHEIPAILAGGPGGTIVNTASISGLVATAGGAAYNAAKHGVIGLTKTAALEFAGAGLRINAVCPGFMRTPMSARVSGDRLDAVAAERTPLGRVAEIDEMGRVVAWLCSAASSYITGVALPVDGGLLAGGTVVRRDGAGGVLFPRDGSPPADGS